SAAHAVELANLAPVRLGATADPLAGARGRRWGLARCHLGSKSPALVARQMLTHTWGPAQRQKDKDPRFPLITPAGDASHPDSGSTPGQPKLSRRTGP